jgi:hypothetical protein
MILQQYGVDTTQWDHGDTDVLEQVIRLVQLNPLAIQTALSPAARGQISWKEYLEELLFRRIPRIQDTIPPDSLFHTRDLTFLGGNTPSLAKVFSMISLYWHQGCFTTDLVESSQGVGCFSFKYQVQAAIDFGVDRGYFFVDSQGLLS